MTVPSPLLVRALNHWRDLDDLTYAGIRLIASTRDDGSSSDTIYQARSRLGWRRAARYRQYSATKSVRVNGPPEYRDCFASSPITAATEAWILDRLSGLKPFANHPAVFSYQWPVGGVARSFQYYYDGYRRRNASLHDVAGESEVVLVLDVKGFYPSLRAADILAAFSRTLERCSVELQTGERAVMKRFVADTLAQTAPVGGIPIGPAIGHVLGNEVLRPLDDRMHARFGARYTRYVDDIALGLRRSEVVDAESRVRDELDKLGLRLHDGKRDIVPAYQWRTYAPGAPRPRQPRQSASFDGLVLRLAHFAATRKPNEVDLLTGRLRELGFRIPAIAFRAALKPRVIDVRSWLSAVRRDRRLFFAISTDTVDSLIKSAMKVRNRLAAWIVDRFVRFEHSGSASPTMARWDLSLTRFVYARWLHVASREMLDQVKVPVEARAVLGDLVAVHEALRSNSLEQILPYSGGPVRLLAELLAAEGRGADEPEWLSLRSARAEIDSVITLTAHGLLEPPASWISRTEEPDRVLMTRLVGRAGTTRQNPDLSAVDELDALLTDESNEQIDVPRTLHSRVDASELSEADRLEILLQS